MIGVTELPVEEKILRDRFGHSWYIIDGLQVKDDIIEAMKDFAKVKAEEAMEKAVGYCRCLKRVNGSIPWHDVRRYNKEWISKL